MSLLLAETVFQAMEGTLDVIALMVFVALIVLFVIAWQVGKIVTLARDAEKRRVNERIARGLEPIIPERMSGSMTPATRPPPVPESATLTQEDLRAAKRYTERIGKRP